MKKTLLLALLAGSFLISCLNSDATVVKEHTQLSPAPEPKLAPLGDHDQALIEDIRAGFKKMREEYDPEPIKVFGVERVTKDEVRLISCAAMEAMEAALIQALTTNQVTLANGETITFFDPGEKLTPANMEKKINGLLSMAYHHWNTRIPAERGGGGFDPASLVVDADDVRERTREKLIGNVFTCSFVNSSIFVRLVGENRNGFLVQAKAGTAHLTIAYQLFDLLKEQRRLAKESAAVEASRETRRQFVDKLRSLMTKI